MIGALLIHPCRAKARPNSTKLPPKSKTPAPAKTTVSSGLHLEFQMRQEVTGSISRKYISGPPLLSNEVVDFCCDDRLRKIPHEHQNTPLARQFAAGSFTSCRNPLAAAHLWRIEWCFHFSFQVCPASPLDSSQPISFSRPGSAGASPYHHCVGRARPCAKAHFNSPGRPRRPRVPLHQGVAELCPPEICSTPIVSDMRGRSPKR